MRVCSHVYKVGVITPSNTNSPGTELKNDGESPQKVTCSENIPLSRGSLDSAWTSHIPRYMLRTTCLALTGVREWPCPGSPFSSLAVSILHLRHRVTGSRCDLWLFHLGLLPYTCMKFQLYFFNLEIKRCTSLCAISGLQKEWEISKNIDCAKSHFKSHFMEVQDVFGVVGACIRQVRILTDFPQVLVTFPRSGLIFFSPEMMAWNIFISILATSSPTEWGFEIICSCLFSADGASFPWGSGSNPSVFITHFLAHSGHSANLHWMGKEIKHLFASQVKFVFYLECFLLQSLDFCVCDEILFMRKGLSESLRWCDGWISH